MSMERSVTRRTTRTCGRDRLGKVAISWGGSIQTLPLLIKTSTVALVSTWARGLSHTRSVVCQIHQVLKGTRSRLLQATVAAPPQFTPRSPHLSTTSRTIRACPRRPPISSSSNCRGAASREGFWGMGCRAPLVILVTYTINNKIIRMEILVAAPLCMESRLSLKTLRGSTIRLWRPRATPKEVQLLDWTAISSIRRGKHNFK